MLNLILQRMVPMITAFVVMLNGIGGVFGVVVVPYNPERVEVSLGSNVNSDIDEVLEYYNAAVKKTGFVLGKTATYYEDFDFADDDFGEFMQVYINELNNQTVSVFAVPGTGSLTEADVKSAKMSSEDGKRTIIIKVKDYSHTFKDNNKNNPITNAFGYTTDLEGYFESIGVDFISGEMEFEYTDCVISCVVDENSGKIIYGDWDSTVTNVWSEVTFSFYGETFTVRNCSYTGKSCVDI